MDVSMPVMDGLDVYREIINVSAESPVVIVVSSSASDEIIQKVVNQGVNFVMHKPLHMQNLLELIGQSIGIEYIREEMPVGLSRDSDDLLKLKSKQLFELPADEIEKLRKSLRIGSMRELRLLAQHVGEYNSELMDMLLQYINDCDIDGLKRLLKRG